MTLIEAASRSGQGILLQQDREGIEAACVFANDASVLITGYSAEELTKLSWLDIVHPRDRDSATHRYRGRMTGKDVSGIFEISILSEGGVEVPLELTSVTTEFQGKTTLVTLFRDITERKQGEAALLESEARHREFLETLPDMVYEMRVFKPNVTSSEKEMILSYVDRIRSADEETVEEVITEVSNYLIPFIDGTIVYTNETAFRKLGYPIDVLGRINMAELIAPEQLVLGLNNTLRMFSEGSQKDMEYDLLTKNKERIVVSISANLSELEFPFLIRGVARDITERRLLESNLAQAQKLESVGRLAAGVAHEINTPMQYVGDNVRFLQEAFHDMGRLLEKQAQALEVSADGDARGDLLQQAKDMTGEIDLPYLTEEIPTAIHQTMEGVEHVSKIVKAMKEFSHPGPEEKSFVDLNSAIESTIMVARNEWKYVAEVEMDLDNTLPPVPCLPGELNQVFLNMIINATHAIGDLVDDGSNGKGKITVSTRQNGHWAEVRISDTGCGIPAGIMDRVFDPFFTTKEVGRGTGQGLAIAYAVIVEKHGGTLTLDSEEGKGTTFAFCLPLEDQSVLSRRSA